MNRLFEKIIDSVFIFWSIYIYREENILETLDNMIQLSRTKHTHTQDKMPPYWSNKQVRDKTTYKNLWIYKLIKLLILSSWLVSSLSLQASRECQSKEKLLEQGFRSAFREFQQWLVNTKINTAKCFDAPQNLSEASSSLQKIQVQRRKSTIMEHSGTYTTGSSYRLISSSLVRSFLVIES